MDINFDSLTFCDLDLGLSEELTSRLFKEVKNTDRRFWFFNDFRNCWMLPLYTEGGTTESAKICNANNPLFWTAASDGCPELKQFVETKVFNWMKPRGRVIIIKTPPQSKMNLHIDGGLSVVQSKQRNLKLRIVLKGPKESLFFLNEQGEKVFIKEASSTYLMDGSHVHGMENLSSESKYTLCIGSPWVGHDIEELAPLSGKIKSHCKIEHPNLDINWIDPKHRG